MFLIPPNNSYQKDMREIFLSGKEKKQIYKAAEARVRRKRSKVGSLLLGLGRSYEAINMLGHGKFYTASELVDAVEQQEIWREYNWRKDELERMKDGGLIDLRDIDIGFEVVLTNQGYVRSIEEKIENCSHRKQNGEYCMITYDIPELFRKDRVKLMRFLKLSGFHMLHRSVWISVMDVSTMLDEYIEELHMSDWVEIVTILANPSSPQI